MAHWNHRVMRREYESGDMVEIIDEIYEVYYKDDGTVDGWTQEPVGPSFYVDGADDHESIKDDIMRFLRACDKPILDYKTGKEIDG